MPLWSHLQHHDLRELYTPQQLPVCRSLENTPPHGTRPATFSNLLGALRLLHIHELSDHVEMEHGTNLDHGLPFVTVSWAPEIAASPALYTYATLYLSVNPGRLG